MTTPRTNALREHFGDITSCNYPLEKELPTALAAWAAFEELAEELEIELNKLKQQQTNATTK